MFSKEMFVIKTASSSLCRSLKSSKCIKNPSSIKLVRYISHNNNILFVNGKVNKLGFRHMSIVREPLESLGDSITTAVLLSWSKKPGDAVKEDDVIGVVETDKVTMDIRAKKSGVFVEGLVAAGAEITVGNELYVIDTAGKAVTSPNATTSSAPVGKNTIQTTTVAAPIPSAAKVTVPVPIMGESITQGVLAKWFMKPGDFAAVDAVVASIETDKVTVEVRSPQDGTISEVLFPEGSEVTVGGPLFTIIPGANPNVNAGASSSAAKPVVSSPASPTKSTATTSAGTSEASKQSETKKSADTANSSSVSAMATENRTETRVKMTRMRLRIAQRLKEAQNTTAMLTTFQECDMTNLIALRNKYKDEFEKIHGVKLGFMSAFVKVSKLYELLCTISY